MISITVDTGSIPARLRGLQSSLANPAHATANAADHVTARIRRHIAALGATRHATAFRLGATPTGHLRASAVRRESATATSATIAIGIPGIARAYRDITIRPRERAALTIPVHRLAYGRTVAEVARGHEIFRPRGKDYLATILPEDAQDRALTVLYLLRGAVRQPRDPSLLPTRDQITQDFLTGFRAALRRSDIKAIRH